jgi:hypothetical protein
MYSLTKVHRTIMIFVINIYDIGEIILKLALNTNQSNRLEIYNLDEIQQREITPRRRFSISKFQLFCLMKIYFFNLKKALINLQYVYNIQFLTKLRLAD